MKIWMKMKQNLGETCINCAQSFSPTNIKVAYISCSIFNQHGYSIGQKKAEEEIMTSSVVSVLLSVYNIQKEDESTIIGGSCCIRCSAVLSRLYQYYVEFNQLRQLESVLSKVVGKNVVSNVKSLPVVTKSQDESSIEIDDSNVSHSVKNSFLSLKDDDGSTPRNSPCSYNDDDDDGDNKNDRDVKQGLQDNIPKLSSQLNLHGPWVKLKRLTESELKQAGIFVKDAAAGRESTTTTNFHQDCSSSSSKRKCHPPQKIETHSESDHLEGGPNDVYYHEDVPGDNKSDSNFDLDKKLKTNNKSTNGRVVSAKSQKSRLPCSICDRTFLTLSHMSQHIRADHGQNLFKCTLCEETFVKKRLYRNHQQNIHNLEIMPFRCEKCGKSFTKECTLKRHVSDVHENMKNVCSFCSENFPSPFYLMRHIKNSHPEEFTTPYQCDQCHRSYLRKPQFERHKKSHTAPPPPAQQQNFLCPHCGRQIKSQQSFQVHMLIHTNEKPHECKICHQFFRHRQALNVHMERHQEGSSNLCSQCGMCFKLRKHLLRHFRVHSDDRPRVCQVEGCGRAFKSKNNLNQHMKIHVENRTKRKGRGIARKKCDD